MTRRTSWRIGGATLAGLATWLVAAAALGSAVTLGIANRAPVTNVGGSSTRASIVITPHAHAVYTLSGDSTRHPKCTASSGCLGVWPPVTVSSTRSLKVTRGIHGHLAVWRHAGLRQLTLNGHPLYTFAGDTRARQATGEGINSFGGIWHVLTPNGKVVAMPAKHTSTPAPVPSCSTGLCY